VRNDVKRKNNKLPGREENLKVYEGKSKGKEKYEQMKKNGDQNEN